MSKIRNCAMIFGLAGVLFMVAADTKDVKATERITYETSHTVGTKTIGTYINEHTKQQIAILEEEKEREEKEKQAALEAAQPERIYDLSEEDYDALLRLVEAEASGEDIKGKMLVTNVVLNRVEDPVFPDTVEEVVYQKSGNKAQFSPVATGKIHRTSASAETVEAVERALCGEDESQGALYFVARAYASPENLHWFETHLTRLFAYHGPEFYA